MNCEKLQFNHPIKELLWINKCTNKITKKSDEPQTLQDLVIDDLYDEQLKMASDINNENNPISHQHNKYIDSGLNNCVSVEYVYLDREEQIKFAQIGHEYLIEQLDDF